MIFSKFLNATNWHKRPYTEILDEVREISEYLDQNSNFTQLWLSAVSYTHLRAHET